ncbi:MAG: hypothetical protein K2N93_04435, partial [Alistipes sp.]|nr:hypothetical protein [Alistipes sp.]
DPKGGTPLYIVDGKERSDLEGIDKERIASITILKDATATERYGERAKSGVIVVTTRGAGSEAVAEAVTEALADGTSVSTSISVSRTGSSEVVVIDKKGAEASVVVSTTTAMTAVCDAEPADRRKSNTVVRVEGNITKIPVEEWKSGNVAVYIDGKKASAKKIDKLDPSKIRTIVVRKDKAAAEEYGEEAADGVILIETK